MMEKKAMASRGKSSIYFHIPFCLSKCDYCDFVSFSSLERKEEYVDSLIADLKSKSKSHQMGEVDSIYFGGGTPSILPAKEISRLLQVARECFCISCDVEITIEVNPKTCDRAKLEAYRKMGINRISVGVQSFEDAQLQSVSRAHTGEEASAILQEVSDVFENFSIDLMLGLPNSTLPAVFRSLRSAIAFRPTHISLYGLQVEEGTKLAKNIENGMVVPREDILCDMFELAERFLGENGYSHYEISNFAKAGKESRHNMGYWRQKEYLGIGISAHSLVEGRRFFSTSDIFEYISNAKKGEFPELLEEVLSKEEMEREYIMLGLRLKDGVLLEEFKEKFLQDFKEKYSSQLSKFHQCLVETKNSIAIKEEYFYVSNQIIAEFM